MQLTDILIHLNEEIKGDEKDKLVDQLRAIEGVIAPRFTKEKNHLLLVSYHSDITNALTLLNEVKDHGYNAQLVGL